MMRITLLINFINQLLNLTETELNNINHYLESLLRRREDDLIMDNEYDEEIILPEIDEENIDDLFKDEELDLIDEDIDEKTAVEDENKDLVEQLKGIKTELKGFKEELIAQNKSQLEDQEVIKEESAQIKDLLKGGDKMKENSCQCREGERCICPPEEIPESKLPDPNGELTVPISCIKVLHDNFFDEYDANRIVSPATENFSINKLDCCREKALIISERTDCLYPAIVEKACGCVEYGVKTTVPEKDMPRADDERPQRIATICCENSICIDEIINYCCCGSTEQVCCCTGVEISISWGEVEVIQDKIKYRNIWRGEDDERCFTEVDLANKAAVVFQGQLTMRPEYNT